MYVQHVLGMISGHFQLVSLWGFPVERTGPLVEKKGHTAEQSPALMCVEVTDIYEIGAKKLHFG